MIVSVKNVLIIIVALVLNLVLLLYFLPYRYNDTSIKAVATISECITIGVLAILAGAYAEHEEDEE